MKYFLSGHITRTIHFIVILAFVPCLITILRFGFERNEVDKRNMEGRIQEVVRSINASQLAEIEHIQEMLKAIAVMEPLRSNDCKSNKIFFSRLTDNNPKLLDMLLADPQGEILVSARNSLEGRELEVLPYMREAIATRSFVISQYLRDNSTGETAMYCLYPILSEKQELQGIIGCAIRMEPTTQDLEALNTLPGASLAFTDNRGKILFSHPKPDGLAANKRLPDDELAVLRASQHGRGMARLHGGLEHERIFAFIKLKSKDEKWIATSIVRVNATIADTEANQSLFNNILTLVISLAAGFLLAIFISWLTLRQPVYKLLKAVRLLGEGQLNARSNLPSLAGEIGQLASGFDSMAQAIESNHTELLEAKQA